MAEFGAKPDPWDHGPSAIFGLFGAAGNDSDQAVMCIPLIASKIRVIVFSQRENLITTSLASSGLTII
jgi:hypothetical protein